jgi:hypothetical protein
VLQIGIPNAAIWPGITPNASTANRLFKAGRPNRLSVLTLARDRDFAARNSVLTVTFL